jgi:2,4-dienoyl-CoA reductase-like NADH-dependent reductase (Old Yellow Enzyme family)
LTNRLRVLAEIWPEIRQAGGEDFILGIRFGGNLPNGKTAVDLAQGLESLGPDLLHVSFGTIIPEGEAPEGYPGLTIFHGTKVKKAVNIPVIGVGAIFDGQTAVRLIEDNLLDYVALGRACLADDKWAGKVLAGQPINRCHNCGGRHRSCNWFKNHEKCPARREGTKSLVD